MMSLYITVGIVMFFPCRCPATATVFQRSTDVRLGVGSSMELACSVTGAIENTRGWTGGPGFSSLITDGVSTDTSKYTESLQTVDFSLHVHNVVVDDVCDVDYQCYNKFDISTILTIVLNSSIFSYFPTSPEIIVQNEVYDSDKKMTILVNLTKVFPEPTCTAKLGNKDVIFLSNSYDNGNCGLKSTEISINNETFDCSGNLKIECTIGSNLFTVYDVKPSSCPADKTCWCFGKCGIDWLCICLLIFFIILFVYIILHCCCCNEKCGMCHNAWCCKESCRCYCPNNGFPCCTHVYKCGNIDVECCKPRKSTIRHNDDPITRKLPGHNDDPITEKLPGHTDDPITEKLPGHTDDPITEKLPGSTASASDVDTLSMYPDEAGRRSLPPLPDDCKHNLPKLELRRKPNHNSIKEEHLF